jgi:hypothetical protein
MTPVALKLVRKRPSRIAELSVRENPWTPRSLDDVNRLLGERPPATAVGGSEPAERPAVAGERNERGGTMSPSSTTGWSGRTSVETSSQNLRSAAQ